MKVLCYLIISLIALIDPIQTETLECYEDCDSVYKPHAPLILCKNLPIDFLNCSEPLNLNGNDTKRKELGYGCTKFGGERYEDVQMTGVVCEVLTDIECFGNRTFIREGFPCIKYNGHYFVTTLIYSVLLGFLGMDRFCLGLTGTAVGKLLTLGGVGIWWIVDVILLVNGMLLPEDGSNWIHADVIREFRDSKNDIAEVQLSQSPEVQIYNQTALLV